MKPKLLFHFILLLISVRLSAQNAQIPPTPVDYKVIEKAVTDSTSAYYYPKLINRYVQSDTSLKYQDYTYIYYGNAFSPAYAPYTKSENEEKFLELYNKERYKRAIAMGEKVLKENPINLNVTYKIGISHNVLGNKPMAKEYAKKYYLILGAIYHSGTGKNQQDAFTVIKVEDEYQILKDLDFKSTSQSLIGDTDKHIISTDNQKSKEPITEIYFNVSMPLKYLQKELNQTK